MKPRTENELADDLDRVLYEYAAMLELNAHSAESGGECDCEAKAAEETFDTRYAEFVVKWARRLEGVEP